MNPVIEADQEWQRRLEALTQGEILLIQIQGKVEQLRENLRRREEEL